MDDCLRGPSRKYSFKVEKMKTIDPIQSFVEFPRPRGPMRNTVGRKVPKLRPNNNDLANYDGIEVIRVRKITRTVKKNKLEIPKGGKRPNTKAAVKKIIKIDPIQSSAEFSRPRGPMRSTVGRKVPKLRPNNDDLAVYDGIEVPRVRKITRTVKKNKLKIPKGRKRPNTKAAVKKKRGAAAKKTRQAKTAYILQSDEKQSTEDPKPEGSNNWLFWKRWFSSDPQTK